MYLGKKVRLERIINRENGRTSSVPMDHGVTLGAVEGLIDMREAVNDMAMGGADAVLMHKGLVRCSHRNAGKDVGLIVHLSDVADEDGGEKLVVLLGHRQHPGGGSVAFLSAAFQAYLVQGRKCGLGGGEECGKRDQNDQRHQERYTAIVHNKGCSTLLSYNNMLTKKCFPPLPSTMKSTLFNAYNIIFHPPVQAFLSGGGIK